MKRLIVGASVSVALLLGWVAATEAHGTKSGEFSRKLVKTERSCVAYPSITKVKKTYDVSYLYITNPALPPHLHVETETQTYFVGVGHPLFLPECRF